MGIVQKIINSASQLSSAEPIFTKDELELLLRTLGNCDFKGREVESVYNLIVKLQNMYVSQNKP